MAPISLTLDAVITARCTGHETFDSEVSNVPSKIMPQKVSKVATVLDVDEEQTTDMGESCVSETESCSGLSCNDGNINRGFSKRCRFGRTALETIPATPSADAASMSSPPGFSRAAMRQARDACKADSNQMTSDESEENSAQSSTDAASSITSSTPCRFGESSFGTVPKTPASGAKWKALKQVIGSPPGLSHTEMRCKRDACKVPTPSWGGCQETAPAKSRILSGERPSAQESLARMKQGASLLKDLKSSQKLESNAKQMPASSVERETVSSCSTAVQALDEVGTSAGTGQQCRFGSTALGTTPSTPAGGKVSSPPGLSRKAMRQARDLCKAQVTTEVSWGASTKAPLTINPSAMPLSQTRQMPR